MTMMAYCGILCSECPAYLATINDDQALREKTAREWSKAYATSLEAKDIQCTGCKSDILFGHCAVCEIRACSQNRGYGDCSPCDEFGCEKLKFVLDFAPGVRERLLSMRK